MAQRNYRRGVLRLYLVLSILWIGWGLYWPILVRRQTVDQYFEDARKQFEDCSADAKKRYSGADYQDMLTVCEKSWEIDQKLPDSIAAQGISGAYRRFRFRRLAMFSLGPPLAAFVVLLAIEWIVGGFNATARQSWTGEK
jgi:hypothetical protein